VQPLSLQCLTQPAIEPVSVLTAKQWLRVDFDDDDVLIGALITAARQLAEKYTHRAFLPQVWQRTLDHFPLWWDDNGSVGPNDRSDWPYYAGFWDRIAIDLPRPTALGVLSITYLDSAGTLNTLNPSQYNVDLTSTPARLVPAQGFYWPTVMTYVPGAVKIVYAAGSYATTQADTLTVPMEAPYTVQLTQAASLFSLIPGAPLLSLVDSSGQPVAYTGNGGAVTVAESYAGQKIIASYCLTSIAAVPQSVITAILMTVNFLYDNRDGIDLTTVQVPMVAKALLAGERVQSFGYRP
jgi:hypothetical protein